MTEVCHVSLGGTRPADRAADGPDEWLTIKELATEWKVSERTIRNRRSLGTLGIPGYKIGGLVRFKRSDVDRCLAASIDGGGEAA